MSRPRATARVVRPALPRELSMADLGPDGAWDLVDGVLRRRSKAAARRAPSGASLPLLALEWFAEPGRLLVVLPVHTHLPNASRHHIHVVATAERRVREAADAYLLALPAPPSIPLPGPWTVELVRLSPGDRVADVDNACAAMKRVQDAVAAWLGCDDGDRARVRWSYEAERASAHGVRATIIGSLDDTFFDPNRSLLRRNTTP